MWSAGGRLRTSVIRCTNKVTQEWCAVEREGAVLHSCLPPVVRRVIMEWRCFGRPVKRKETAPAGVVSSSSSRELSGRDKPGTSNSEPSTLGAEAFFQPCWAAPHQSQWFGLSEPSDD